MVVTHLDSGHVLKAEPKVYPGGLDVECERMQAIKDDYKVWGLSNWMDGTPTA